MRWNRWRRQAVMRQTLGLRRSTRLIELIGVTVVILLLMARNGRNSRQLLLLLLMMMQLK